MKRIVIREGLETPEQRAWWFAHLKDEDESESTLNTEKLNYENKNWKKDYLATAKTQASKLTPKEDAALKDYVSKGTPPVNWYLRGSDPTKEKYIYIHEGGKSINPSEPIFSDLIKDRIKTMDQMIERDTIPEGTVLYRGTGRFGFENLVVGGTIKDPGYSSFSADKEHASAFGYDDPAGKLHILKIQTESGQHGHYADTSNVGHESEVILPRGSTFKINAITDDGEYRTYHAKILP